MFLICEVPNCKRKATRIKESVGWGERIYSCGYCCRSSSNYFSTEYGKESVIEVKSPNHWKKVSYDCDDYIMVWCKL